MATVVPPKFGTHYLVLRDDSKFYCSLITV